jgi:hypothetical protein
MRVCTLMTMSNKVLTRVIAIVMPRCGVCSAVAVPS